MNFVKYMSKPFANLANKRNVILEANKHLLAVNSIIICNRGDKPIRIFLKKIRNQLDPTEIFYVNELELAAYQTLDIFKELNISIFLEFQNTPNINDSIICYSKGYSQIFDCEISYTELNELPNII